MIAALPGRRRCSAGVLCMLALLHAPRAAAQLPPRLIDQYRITTPAPQTFPLPGRLRTISGFITVGERHFAHDHDSGILYEVSKRGEVLKWFSVGKLPLHASFVGLAFVNGRFWLADREGNVYETEEAAAGGAAPFRKLTMELPRECRVRNVSADRGAALRLLCVPTLRPGWRGDIVLLTVEPVRGKPAFTVTQQTRIRLGNVTRAARAIRGFDPVAVLHDAARQHDLLMDARGVLIEVDRDGRLVGTVELLRTVHPSPVVLSTDASGTLYIVDQGNPGNARVAYYPISRRRR